MNAEAQQQEDLDVRRLARAIRFAVVAIVIAVSLLSLRSSLAIGNFEKIFEDMLGRPSQLPILTIVIFRLQFLFITIGVLVPIIAVLTLFSRKLVGSFYVLGVLLFVAVTQFLVLFTGLVAPLTTIIEKMNQ